MNSSEGLLCLRFGGLRLTQCAYVIMPGWCRSPSVSKRAGCTDPALRSRQSVRRLLLSKLAVGRSVIQQPVEQ